MRMVITAVCFSPTQPDAWVEAENTEDGRDLGYMQETGQKVRLWNVNWVEREMSTRETWKFLWGEQTVCTTGFEECLIREQALKIERMGVCSDCW